MSLLSKKAVIYNCNNGDQGKVFLNGEELPQCIRCCPDKKWADIMLNDDKGRVLLNAAKNHVIVVRVIGDHVEFKPSKEMPPGYENINQFKTKGK